MRFLEEARVEDKNKDPSVQMHEISVTCQLGRKKNNLRKN